MAREAMGRIVAVANQKGGVGKTTTAVNLAAALAERGRHVLLIDLDPQANATASLGLKVDGQGIYEVLTGQCSLAAVLVQVPSSGDGVDQSDSAAEAAACRFDMAPSSVSLIGADLELIDAADRERRLARALGPPVLASYDYILIDCPPALSLLTVNALAAADTLLVPVQCEYLALEGLSHLLTTLQRVRQRLNPSLQEPYIVMTMSDARTNLARQVVAEVRQHFDRSVLQTVIPRTVRLGEAPSYGQSVLTYDPASRGAVAYRALAVELEEVLADAAA